MVNQKSAFIHKTINELKLINFSKEFLKTITSQKSETELNDFQNLKIEAI